MSSKRRIPGIVVALALVAGGFAYVFTAPYPGNTGLQRTLG